jgi:diguanylate cyclase
MTIPSDEHERTMAFAEIALGQIRALRQPASPRHFEIWYTYATGYNPSLNQMINEMLSRNGTLREADIEQIYESYISPSRFTDRIDRVGSKVMDEIEQVMAMIGAAAGTASSYTENLANVSQKLGVDADDPTVRAIVESLVTATAEMQQNNQALEARLSASKQEIDQLQENLETVRTESLTDPLTTLANRKSFDDALVRAIAEARARDEHLSLLLTDVDHFKKFNDTFGHLTGDQVLRLVAISVKQNVKGQDIAARYGGEEFAVVLPNTVLRSAVTVADHIRCAVMGKELMKRSTGEHLGRVTISVGVATLRPDDTPQTLIERADSCLYAAKRNGRNQVIGESDPEAANTAAPKVA